MLKPRTVPRDQQGSIVIAMSVIMVLGLLSLATVTRSVSNTTNVRRTQDFGAALAAADSGMSDALYQIDQVQSATFTQAGSAGAGGWNYTATLSATDPNSWGVKSTGTINGVKHAIQATVSREAVYPYAIFTRQDLTFNGNGGTNIISYNPVSGVSNTHHAFVGSNHAITISGGGGGDEQDYYTPNGSCSGCSNAVQKNGPRAMADPVQPASGQSCPAGGTFNGTVDGQGGNTFICNQNVSFGTVTVVNAPVQIFVGAGYSVDLSNASVNMGATAKGKDFLLLKAGTGSFAGFNGGHSPSVRGVIYAPNSDITVNGGQMEVDGSLTLNQFTLNGNPNFSLSYDDSVSTIASGNWAVSNWHEVPST